VVDVRDRQRSFVRVEFVAWKSALQTALLALPSGLIFDRRCNLIPIVWVLGSVHRHGNNPIQWAGLEPYRDGGPFHPSPLIGSVPGTPALLDIMSRAVLLIGFAQFVDPFNECT
jgi:hypothetical protein